MSLELADMHVHVDFVADPEKVVRESAAARLALLANTVTPAGYLESRDASWSQAENVRLGLHPWWAADGRLGRQDADLACELLPCTRFVGEVGLDFSDGHTPRDSHEAQAGVLRKVLSVCGRLGGRVISLHSVRSADLCLDLLEETGCLGGCSCVFHWFSGSTTALWRAIHAGCLFSVNERQAGTRRGREQLKLVPTDQLLLETDLPAREGDALTADAIAGSLRRAARTLAGIRAAAPEDILAATSENAARLLGMDG